MIPTLYEPFRHWSDGGSVYILSDLHFDDEDCKFMSPDWITPEEAFNEGWDYPPRMGGFGIVGPRTCGDCSIYLTVWWALVVEKKRVSELSQQQKETIKRIQGEPESIIPEED